MRDPMNIYSSLNEEDICEFFMGCGNYAQPKKKKKSKSYRPSSETMLVRTGGEKRKFNAVNDTLVYFEVFRKNSLKGQLVQKNLLLCKYVLEQYSAL